MSTSKPKKIKGRPTLAPTQAATKHSERAAAEPSPSAPPQPPSSEPAPQSAPADGASGAPDVVGIGAGAGGIEAFARLLKHLPGDTGMAFVFISHLDPTANAHPTEILSRATSMPVITATHLAPVEPNHVYFVAPDTMMILAGERLEIEPRPRDPHLPVDAFFRSLALDRKSYAVGVVLSGDGTDGALGLGAIKAEGGLTFAQDVHSAKHDGMPVAALTSGSVDFSMPPDEMARELASITEALRGAYEGASRLEREEDLQTIFAMIQAAHDVDFASYRLTTIKRRIIRRMVLLKMRTVREYTQFLKERPAEIEALYQDILIKVTRFFRDPEVFEALKSHVFTALLAARPAEEPIRAWVPGCATGEEAYSIAIALLEALAEANRADVPILIFATDVSEPAIERARAGVYAESIALDVSAERLRRFFTKNGKHYQVSDAVRRTCVFGKQDVTHDPPFPRLDLVSCRNVMIYLDPSLQTRLVPVLHHALKPSGFLVLGSSEALAGSSELFSLVDKKNKIYAKIPAPSPPFIERSSAAGHDHDRPRATRPPARPTDGIAADMEREADRLVLDRFAPAGVIVDADLQIQQVRGHTGAYLEPAPGEASLHLLRMAREALLPELRAAIARAKREGTTVRVEGVELHADGRVREIAVEVIPLRGVRSSNGAGLAERWYLVLFDETARRDAAPKLDAAADEPGANGGVGAHREKLEQELASTREHLQAIIEEQAATNEELASSNEELQSTVEELQSINEVVETTREELQSTNDELTRLNVELERRNAELSSLNADLGNLLASVDIPIVMLSNDLRIRRFTPQAGRLFNLIQGDAGRRIGDVRPSLRVTGLERSIAEVIGTETIFERDVQDREGRWYAMRIRPYRTVENKVDGAVICLFDIDTAKNRPSDEKG